MGFTVFGWKIHGREEYYHWQTGSILEGGPLRKPGWTDRWVGFAPEAPYCGRVSVTSSFVWCFPYKWWTNHWGLLMLGSRWGVLAILFFFSFPLLCKNDTINIKYNCKQIMNLVFTILWFSTASFYMEGICSCAMNVDEVESWSVLYVREAKHVRSNEIVFIWLSPQTVAVLLACL